MNFAKHHELFERFSKLINDKNLSTEDLPKWSRFLTVASEHEILAIVEAMEGEVEMIQVLTQNLDDKLDLAERDAHESKWRALFDKERSFLDLT